MLSAFGEEMIKIAVSKSAPWTKEARFSKVQQGLLAGVVGTVGAEQAAKDISVGHRVRKQQRRQLKAQRMMQRYGG